MKKVMLFILFFTISFIPTSFAQGSPQQYQLPYLLTYYYNIKNALVVGDAGTAALNAEAFLKIANTIDYKVISEGNLHALVQDATLISESKNVNGQRSYFANFSANMATVARSVKLTDEPVYVDYCPMKKAYWLSSEKEIKNPYYGNSMLTCGKVTATLQ